MLQNAANVPLGDWFEYAIGATVMDLEAAPYGVARFPVEARMDDRIFARFHLDTDIGDVFIEPLETIACRDWLSFAGIETARVRMIAREQQFAEKVHAYTLPRQSTNSRVKDLVDLGLLAGSGKLNQETDSGCFASHVREEEDTRSADAAALPAVGVADPV